MMTIVTAVSDSETILTSKTMISNKEMMTIVTIIVSSGERMIQ